MKREHADIFISGGGLAGLIAAAAFGHAGFSVILADPGPADADPDQKDLRSTAYLQPAQSLLAEIGLWDTLQPLAVPLQALRIVDTIGDPPELRDERAFNSEDMGENPFGWNFLNWVMRAQVMDFLSKQHNITLKFGTGFKSMLTRTTGAFVTLTNGSQISTDLIVGADGRNSAVRSAAGIDAVTTRYGQKSLAFTATHVLPHNNVSTEIYHHGGPFTMVPLGDVNGVPASAIVWMNEGRRSVDLAAMEPVLFNQEMNKRSANLFGPMELASERAVWPIITQRATHLAAERVALIAEAAHVLPPIGAQGLNTSLNDVIALVETASAQRDNLGAPAMLAAYAKARETDILRRTRIIDLFNRVTRSRDIGLQSLRLTGLKAAHDIAPLRKGLMRAGMGPV